MRDGEEPLLSFPDWLSWDAWLTEHQATSGAVWLRLARRGSSVRSPTFEEALDVALCHGWIDSQRRSLDELSYRQRFSPRRPGSPWSAVNVAKVERLTAEGRMREGGLAQVRAAREDGRWDDAYAAQRDAPVPEDLIAALTSRPAAASRFAALGRTERYLLVLPMLKARTPRSRERQLVRALARLEQPGDDPTGSG